jgi:hypothetical protein
MRLVVVSSPENVGISAPPLIDRVDSRPPSLANINGVASFYMKIVVQSSKRSSRLLRVKFDCATIAGGISPSCQRTPRSTLSKSVLARLESIGSAGCIIAAVRQAGAEASRQWFLVRERELRDEIAAAGPCLDRSARVVLAGLKDAANVLMACPYAWQGPDIGRGLPRRREVRR